jgi:hypothetical protein
MQIASLSQYMPSLPVSSPSQMVSNLTMVAVPLITLVGLYRLQGVSATPYTDCIDMCNTHSEAHPLAILLCQLACLIFVRD